MGGASLSLDGNSTLQPEASSAGTRGNAKRVQDKYKEMLRERAKVDLQNASALPGVESAATGRGSTIAFDCNRLTALTGGRVAAAVGRAAVVRRAAGAACAA